MAHHHRTTSIVYLDRNGRSSNDCRKSGSSIVDRNDQSYLNVLGIYGVADLLISARRRRLYQPCTIRNKIKEKRTNMRWDQPGMIGKGDRGQGIK